MMRKRNGFQTQKAVQLLIALMLLVQPVAAIFAAGAGYLPPSQVDGVVATWQDDEAWGPIQGPYELETAVGLTLAPQADTLAELIPSGYDIQTAQADGTATLAPGAGAVLFGNALLLIAEPGTFAHEVELSLEALPITETNALAEVEPALDENGDIIGTPGHWFP